MSLPNRIDREPFGENGDKACLRRKTIPYPVHFERETYEIAAISSDSSSNAAGFLCDLLCQPGTKWSVSWSSIQLERRKSRPIQSRPDDVDPGGSPVTGK